MAQGATALIASAALVYSLANWDRVGPGFHSMYTLSLSGVCIDFTNTDLKFLSLTFRK